MGNRTAMEIPVMINSMIALVAMSAKPRTKVATKAALNHELHDQNYDHHEEDNHCFDQNQVEMRIKDCATSAGRGYWTVEDGEGVAETAGDVAEAVEGCKIAGDWRQYMVDRWFGSIVSGAIQSKLSAPKGKSGAANSSTTNKKHQRGSFSFLGGMQTLTDALCKDLGKDELKLQSKVLELSYSCNENSPSENWSVSIHSTQSKEQTYDAVIMTVRYLPLSVIITTFKKESVRRPLEGFGVLVPTKEQQNGLKTLGTLFSSMMFPDRAPNDSYLYTTFVGGSRNEELAKASMDKLKQIVTSDLRRLLGAEGEPTFVNHFYWSKAFPLYGHNYDAVLQAIEKMEENLPGFFYAGNHRGGLSVGKAISSGCKAADLVISYLENSSDDKMFEEKPC
ncbi:flavin containing amine oxidoreductase family [Actinidia rufa]|uniref:Flavin containing amine oxidoreductase family n=1 Tax=Actinidia rufa TaxID=165716 RepID=A0A7J0ELI7_9ERIC|nr:flavin containing amine oxidoreductase family [Actinidia rufa]